MNPTILVKKKAHKQRLFGPVGLGTTPGLSQGQTWFVPWANPVCPWDKPRFAPYFTQWKQGLCLGQTQLVPGTLTWGRGAAEKDSVLKVYVPFSLATYHFQENKEQGGLGSVRLRFGKGTVRAVPAVLCKKGLYFRESLNGGSEMGA